MTFTVGAAGHARVGTIPGRFTHRCGPPTRYRIRQHVGGRVGDSNLRKIGTTPREVRASARLRSQVAEQSTPGVRQPRHPTTPFLSLFVKFFFLVVYLC